MYVRQNKSVTLNSLLVKLVSIGLYVDVLQKKLKILAKNGHNLCQKYLKMLFLISSAIAKHELEHFYRFKFCFFGKQVFIDALLALTLLTAVFSVKFDNGYLMLLSGWCMCYTVISAHNFFHHRDNFRMLYFNLAFFNYKEWRISHAMSHHLFPNSLHDLEITLFEPLLCWFPSPLKSIAQRYVSWIYSPIIYTFMCLDQLVKRVIFSMTSNKNLFQYSDLVPLILPITMILFGNSNLFIVFRVWLQIILVNSFLFGLIGLNAGHHHPDNVHEGDKVRYGNYAFIFFFSKSIILYQISTHAKSNSNILLLLQR